MSAKLKSAGAGHAPAPSEQIIKATTKEASAVDSTGRLIVLRKPSTWQLFELPRILGADSINPGWNFQARMLLHVVQIGDDTDVFFRNERELKAVVEMLGDAGMEVAETLFMAHFMPSKEDAAEIKK